MVVYNYIKIGLSPVDICKKLGKSKTSIQYYLSNLKHNGLIEKIGYGVWETSKPFKEVQKTSRHGRVSSDLNLFSSDRVRGHGFMFKVRLPVLDGWVDRVKVFEKLGVRFSYLNIAGGGQKLVFRGRKVWVTNKSIIIYEKASFLSDSAGVSKNHAVSELLKVIRGLEGLLKADFRVGGKYKFCVCRQHYALVKNALAKQFDAEGKRLNVYCDGGLWFLIDNSFNLHEAECVHVKTGVSDTNKVQSFFNGLKVVDDYTPGKVLEMLGKTASVQETISENQVLYAKNIESHIAAIKQLGLSVKELTKIVKELGG